MIWQRAKLKYVTRLIYGDPLPRIDMQEGYVREGSVKVFGSNGTFASCHQANTKAPAIVIGRKGSYGKINWSQESCFASDTTFFVDETTTKQHLRWLFYLLQTLNLDQGTDEAAVPGLNRDDAYEKEVLVPPLVQQIAIANYLDHETAKIDNLISAKERLLELLAEKRHVIINDAVTHGLKKNPALNKVDIPWLDRIPEHWRAERGRYIFIQSSLPVRENDEIVTCFRDGQVTLRRNRREEGFTNAIQELGYQGIRSGQLVLHSMDAFAGAIGVSDSDGKCSPEYIICNPANGSVFNPYYAHLLRVMALQGFVQASCPAVRERAPRIRFSDLADMLLPVPPVNEQEDICLHIATKTGIIDHLKNVALKTIQLLQERRTALITAAVT
ncbi:hypothetical protein WDZ92_05020, partial [Nostoc sp. NIES-2111]